MDRVLLFRGALLESVPSPRKMCASRSERRGSAWTCTSTKYPMPALRILSFSIALTASREPATPSTVETSAASGE
jgi:hypothetical protein